MYFFKKENTCSPDHDHTTKKSTLLNGEFLIYFICFQRGYGNCIRPIKVGNPSSCSDNMNLDTVTPMMGHTFS